jgi:hypothetical protein
VDFSVPVDCVNTVDTNIGASCTANTSADAVVPGVIKEGKNAVVDVFRVRLNDFGNKNFAMQGIYNP